MNRSELERELTLLSDTLNFIDNFTEFHNVDLKSWDAFNFKPRVPEDDSPKLSTESHSIIVFKGKIYNYIFRFYKAQPSAAKPTMSFSSSSYILISRILMFSTCF